MDHSCNIHVNFCASLKIYKKGSQFCFSCASEDAEHFSAFDMNWSIEWGLLQ